MCPDRFKAPPAGGSPQFGGAVTTPAGYLLALWRHECERVFCDKLVSAEDKAWAAAAILELAQCAHVLGMLMLSAQQKAEPFPASAGPSTQCACIA